MSAGTSTAVLRLGTRRSALATAQSQQVADALRALGAEVELVGVTTAGDRSAAHDVVLADTVGGGVGVFVTELRAQLLAGEVDLVVHSLKDLPTAAADRLVVAAIPRREDPRDALVSASGARLAELPAGAIVGTGAPRRVAQVRALRPDLDVRPIRGNVDTRLAKLAAGDFDAVVLAAAGLARLGRLGEASEIFAAGLIVPAPGQGALAIECRESDLARGGRLAGLLEGLDDPDTRAAVTAERTLLAELEAGCTAPVGGYAEVAADRTLHLVGNVVSVDGVTAIRRSITGSASQAQDLGRRLAAELFAAGAATVIGDRPSASQTENSRDLQDRTGRR